MAELKTKWVGYITQEVSEQRRRSNIYVVKQVGDAYIGQMAIPTSARALMCNVLLAIEALITAVTPFLHTCEQPGERRRLAGRGADAGRLGRAFQPRQVLALLAWRITADQRMHTAVPGGDTLVEVPQGQVGIVTQRRANIPGGQVPHHQRITLADLSARA